jgi:hypothetical protein
MEHIAPLIQTVLWVGLITGTLWRFHAPIYGVLVALQKRIEAGSDVKAGPFEISDKLKPQNSNAQNEKATAEAQDALDARIQAVPAAKSVVGALTQFRDRYFQAEDLALRAIQIEYGSPIKRQVTAGRDDGFDGVFVTDGRTNVIEVKYIANQGQNQRLKQTVQRLTSTIQQYGWPNTQIILALVYEREEDVKHAREMLSVAFAQNEVPVVIRVFTIPQLYAQFGIGEQYVGEPAA